MNFAIQRAKHAIILVHDRRFNKKTLIIVCILALVVGFYLIRNPNQKDEETTESSQKITKVTLTNWERYDASKSLPQGMSYPTYSINIPDALFLRANNQVNADTVTTSWSSNPNVDTGDLKEGFFITVDVEMNPKTSKGGPFTRLDYQSETVTDCDGTPEIWNFAGLRAARYVCDYKPAVIVAIVF